MVDRRNFVRLVLGEGVSVVKRFLTGALVALAGLSGLTVSAALGWLSVWAAASAGVVFVALTFGEAAFRTWKAAASERDEYRTGELDDNALGERCWRVAASVNDFIFARMHEKPKLVVGEATPEQQRRIESDQRLHDARTARLYEKRFAAEVYSLLRVLRDRRHLREDEIEPLNYPSDIYGVYEVRERLEALSRRLRSEATGS